MNKRKWRFIRCIWHDKVDMIMWLVTIGLFIFSLIKSPYPISDRVNYGDVSPFLFVLIFYLYYFMYRKFTFWQDRMKMHQELKNRNVNIDFILNSEDW